MYMSLVNHNKSSEVISAAESLEFAVCGHVHVLICMVCHKETKKTRANVVFVCIFYTFFCFRFFFYLFFFFVFLKFQISKICLHFITYHTN